MASFYRIIDSSANRACEALRVVEDFVRFICDEASLTEELKTMRHQLTAAMRHFSMAERLQARDTEADVGTHIQTRSEYTRADVNDVLAANFSRLQESLRSLEEFSKIESPETAAKFEQLRYRSYTLQKRIFLNGLSGSGNQEGLNAQKNVKEPESQDLLADPRNCQSPSPNHEVDA